MKYKLILGLIILSILSSFVFASDNAPPALPMEVWGNVTVDGSPAINGLVVRAEVDGVNYAQASVTSGGEYNIILAGGDHELTNLSDYNCAIANAAGRACIPCSTDPLNEDYCIEGPQDRNKIIIKVDSNQVMPAVDWVKGTAENINSVTPLGDWDKNGCVDMADFGYFANNYNQICAYLIPEACDYYDLFRDYGIDMADFGIFANYYGRGC